MTENQTRYKFQYCTLWNKQIPGLVLRDVESNISSDIYFEDVEGPVPEYYMGGSFLCNIEVDRKDLERPFKGIETLLKLQSKYDGTLNVPVTIPFSEYIRARSSPSGQS